MREQKSNYELCYERLCREFGKHDPEEMARKSGASYDPERGEFTLHMLDKEYIISYPDGKIALKSGEESEIDTDESTLEKKLILRDEDEGLFQKMIILSYLHRAQKRQPVGKWVSYRELRGAGVYYDAFVRYGIKPMAEFFGDKGDIFLRASKALGGKEFSIGDVGMEFRVLPNIPIVLVLWLGDEEFPASANILYDYGATEEIHVEDLASLGPWLVRQVIKKAKEIMK